MKKFSLFESTYKKFMNGIVSEAKEFDKFDKEGLEVGNDFGVGYDKAKGGTYIDWSAEPLSQDYDRLNGKAATIDPYSEVVYCKPETNAKKTSSTGNLTSIGQCCVHWVKDFKKICDNFNKQFDSMEVDTIPQASINDREVQVYGVMLDVLFTGSGYHPMPVKYTYYRVDIGQINSKIYSGNLEAAIAENPDEVVKKIDSLKNDPAYVTEFSLGSVIRKSDNTYSPRKATFSGVTTVLDEKVCLTKEQFAKVKDLFSKMSINEIMANCKKRNDGTENKKAISLRAAPYETPSEYVAATIGNNDNPIAVGTTSNFMAYEGFVNCIRISDLIDRNASLREAGDAIKSQQGAKESRDYVVVYVWNETPGGNDGFGAAKKLYLPKFI